MGMRIGIWLPELYHSRFGSIMSPRVHVTFGSFEVRATRGSTSSFRFPFLRFVLVELLSGYISDDVSTLLMPYLVMSYFLFRSCSQLCGSRYV